MPTPLYGEKHGGGNNMIKAPPAVEIRFVRAVKGCTGGNKIKH
jgi:hypothetical protein